MTSAVLAGRNEVHHAKPHHGPWGGPHGASLKPKHSIPPKPRHHRPPRNPNPIPRPAEIPLQEPALYAAPPPQPSGLRYVTIQLAGMTRLEARQAQARLTGELGRVRALLARISTWEGEPRRELAPEPEARPSPPLRHGFPTPPSLRTAMLKRCGQILTRLLRQRACHWFKAPVDVEGLKLHDYHNVIRNPMDLGTVKKNLTGGRYPSHEEFAADVRLTFNNALLYNQQGLQVHTAAGNLLASFERMYKEAISWFEQEFLRLEPPMPLALPSLQPVPLQPLDVPVPLQPLDVPVPLQPFDVPVPLQPLDVPVQAVPRMGGGRRPKAREPNWRELNSEEKEKLREEIENLQDDQTENVLQIVQKRSSVPALRGEEVELDFQVMDAETLWELHQYFLNLRKAHNKSSQNVVVNGDAVVSNAVMVDVAVVPDEDDTMQEVVNPPIVVEIGDSEQAIEADMADEYVDIGDEMSTVNYQSVEIEKDTQMASSSSESGSGSSSSNDSGSRSSPDSDSDGDDAHSPD